MNSLAGEDVRRSVIRHDLQLSVQIQSTVHKTSSGSGGVTGGKGLERVVDFLFVACADGSVVHDGAKADADASISVRLD